MYQKIYIFDIDQLNMNKIIVLISIIIVLMSALGCTKSSQLEATSVEDQEDQDYEDEEIEDEDEIVDTEELIDQDEIEKNSLDDETNEDEESEQEETEENSKDKTTDENATTEDLENTDGWQCEEDSFQVVRVIDDQGKKTVYRNECLNAAGFADYLVEYYCKETNRIGFEEKKCSRGCEIKDRRYGARCK